MTLARRLRFAAALPAAALMLAACGGGNGDADEAYVDTLRRGISAKVGTLDPHRSSAQWENIVIGDMFEGLLTEGPDSQPVPGMAKSYSVDDTGTVYTFNLRDATWSDGEPVTADDFVFALQRIQRPETASQYSSLLYIMKNAQAVNEGRLPPEELGVTAIDDKTLEIRLEAPAPYLPELLTHYTTFPVPKHVVEQHGDAWIRPENIEVNGPYKLVFWQTGDQLVTEANPLWHGGAENLCFERVVYLELENLPAVERRIRNGDLDINNAFEGGRKEELQELLPGWVRTSPALLTTYWTFNTSIAPFDDVRVRRALAMALDREFMVEQVLTPGYIPAYSFVPPTIANYDTERPEVSWKDLSLEERRAEARRLLEEAGFGPDNPLRFEYIYRSTGDNPKPPPVAEQNWEAIAPWVDAVTIRQDTQALYARLRQADFEVSDAAWVADYSDPKNFLYLLESATGQQNYGNYSNPEYDALLAASDRERDPERRAELFAQAEKLILEDTPITPMWFAVTQNLVDPEMTGWEENGRDNHRSRWLCLPGTN